MSAALTAVIALWTIAAPAPSAPAADYGLDADAWNGVGYLITTAAEARVDLTPVDDLDLAALRTGDVLLWLYPSAPLPDADLLAFVADGGHLVVADDVGASAALLRGAGLERLPAPPAGHARWFEQQEGFPVLRAHGEHFLFFNVDEIVANHPAALRGAGTPIVSYDDAAAHLVVERAWGAGTLLAIADASLFINQMLRRFYGNKQFAANVLRLYCRREPCAVRLLLPTSTVHGRYTPGLGRLGPLPRLVEQAAAAVNDVLAALNGSLGAPPVTLALSVALTALIALGGALLLATWRRPAPRPPVASPVPSHAPAVADAIGLASARAEADFSALAATLAEQADRLLASRSLEAWVSGHRPPPAGESEESLDLLRHAELRVKRDTASLRSRQPPLISAERFVRLYDDVHLIARFGTARR